MTKQKHTASIVAEDSTITAPVLQPESDGEPAILLPDPLPPSPKKHRFFKGLCIYFVLLLAASAVLLWFLYHQLEQYESSTPSAALNTYLQWIQEENYEAMYDAAGYEDTALNSKSDYIAYLQSLYDDAGEIELREKITSDSNLLRYALYSNGQKLSEITVSRSPEGDGTSWCTTTDLVYQDAYTVTASEDLSLTVNGTEIHLLSFPSVEIQNEIFLSKEDAEVTLPVIRQYTLEGFLNPPTIVAHTLSGDECTVVKDGNDWSVLIPVSGDIRTAQETLATNAATTYAKFVAKDEEKYTVLKKVHKSSQLYQTIRSFSNTWFSAHQTYEFRDLTVTDYTCYSTQEFSCTVSFRPIYTRYGKVIEDPTVHYRMTFLLEGEDWLLYSLQQQTAVAESTTESSAETVTTTATTAA